MYVQDQAESCSISRCDLMFDQVDSRGVIQDRGPLDVLTGRLPHRFHLVDL